MKFVDLNPSKLPPIALVQIEAHSECFMWSPEPNADGKRVLDGMQAAAIFG